MLLLSFCTVSAATKYVWQDSPNPTPPYSSWATAAHVIQDAVDAANPGDTVLVTNGVYTTGGAVVDGETNRVAVDKPLNLMSMNGAGATIIDGLASVRCVYLANNASLSGFTLTNGAAGRGAGAWCRSTNAVLSNCVLIHNSARRRGGGVSGGALNNCTLTGNSADWGGGVYQCQLDDCVVSSNSSSYGGGAFECTLNQCTLVQNRANDGGGAYESTLNHCILTSNYAAGGGGALRCTLNNCTLSNNSANYGGGGAWNCTLNNCVLTDNLTRASGGGTLACTLNGCMFVGNSAFKYGGGASGCALNNCTLTDNSASIGGGSSGGTLNNCIVYFNVAAEGANHFRGTLNFCCTTPLPTNGLGNIDLDPQLASFSRVSSGSPCIGAGSAVYATGTDLDGEPWADPPSIGCDEYHVGSVTGPLSVGIGATYKYVPVDYVVQFTALIGGRITGHTWDFGDGLSLSNQLYVSHAWSTAGEHSVTLRAYNESHPEGISETVTVTVATQPVHYVAADAGNPLPPYTSWATAASSLQDAVDIAAPGSQVLVTNGVYRTGGRPFGTSRLTNRVAVEKPLHLLSVNGPKVTIIEGNKADDGGFGGYSVRCVSLADGARLTGFTLTNGATFGNPILTSLEISGGGVWCESSASTVTECVLIGNSAYAGGGGAFRGRLNGCTIISNSAYSGGGAAGGTLVNCDLIGNSARGLFGGGGAIGSTLVDCRLLGNSSGGGGGGASFSTLHNCALVGNSAVFIGGGAGTFNNCTLVGNTASNRIGGASGSLTNCIVYFNAAPDQPNCSTNSSLAYTCTYPMPTNGVGNITNAPLFVDTNDWADLRLMPDSPCIDTGNNDFVIWATDLDGNPRIINGIVDMGAYEFVPPTAAELVDQLIAQVSASGLQHKQPLLATLNATLASIERGNCHSAVGQLGAFQNKVQAQVPDAVLVDELIEGARQLIAALDCPGSSHVAAKIRSLKRQADGRLQMQVEGAANQVCLIEASTNLVDWQTVGTATVSADGTFEFEDPAAANHLRRFYRVVTQPVP